MDVTRSPSFYPPYPSLERVIYLLSQDAAFAAQISEQVMHFGYSVQPIRTISQVPTVTPDQAAFSVIVDVPADASAQDLFDKLDLLASHTSNLIFTSVRDSQEVRLKAIAAGGTAFFTRPVNVVSLIDRLDTLNLHTTAQQPPRVMIIDHQNAVASYYQMVLKMSGIDTRIESQPENVLEHMLEYHPDLILMNRFLPGINTVDLARVIRQMDDFLSIPLIFLSNDDDFEMRKEALDLGIDDFLVKPVKAAHLIAVVRSRLDRSKTLRSYMVRDSLTNLLNHTAFRNVLSQEVSRCRRQNAVISLAMLDIDHFKRVNDTYGHAAGDSAIKVLSRLLKQRLRNSDIVGRYGGDEFVALLLGCKSDQAKTIMDEIRQHFAEVEFRPNETRSLNLTFSCGISAFPQYQSAESLSDAADQALYNAKAGLRNCIVVA